MNAKTLKAFAVIGEGYSDSVDELEVASTDGVQLGVFTTIPAATERLEFDGERVLAVVILAAADLERITTERDALQLRLNAADQQIDDHDGTCEWSQEDDSGIWNSGCGTTWSFHDDGPTENGMHFCHSCGKALVVTADEQEPAVDYGPTPGCKQCEEAERCGFTDCPECDAQLCNDVNGNGFQPGREPA